MSAARLNQDTLRSLVHYDPETGAFTWLKRERDVNGWNRKYAGREPGTINSRGYRCITIEGRAYKAHRLSWLYVFGEFPELEIDHINRNPDDNRIVNLRATTHSRNVRNTLLRKTNKSGFPGVAWYKRGKKWQVQISVGGRKAKKRVYHVGYFSSIDEAKSAYEAAHLKNFGYLPVVLSEAA